jgi:hypothetical protein
MLRLFLAAMLALGAGTLTYATVDAAPPAEATDDDFDATDGTGSDVGFAISADAGKGAKKGGKKGGKKGKKGGKKGGPKGKKK